MVAEKNNFSSNAYHKLPFFKGVGPNYAFPNSYIQQNQLDSWNQYIQPSVLKAL